MATAAELTYNTSASAMQMAQTIFGGGTTVVSATYSGDSRSSAIYSNGDLTGGVTPSDTGVILSTGRADSFTNSWGDPNRNTNTSTNTSGIDNNAQFNAIAGTTTYDASWLDVTFIPTGDTMTISFVFASEEYPEYAGSVFNDVVGVWINGTHVPLSAASGPTAVGSVNETNNENLYVSNANDQYNTEMDGFTVTMTLTIPVTANAQNTIRIGIADVADAQYDSNLLIAADSAQTSLIANDDDYVMMHNATHTFDVLQNDENSTGGTLVITHINGIAVVPGQTITLTTGETITLNANGTITVVTDDQLEDISFTYEVDALDGAGNTLESATGMVTLETIPCFVAGTRITTKHGLVAVEDLSVGDLVFTLDHGYQPLRWVGQKTVEAVGAMAPVQIRRGVFGDHNELMVSPQHRVMVRDPRAALLFGTDEVLVKARDLVDGRRVRRVEGGSVTYVHLLFDRHEVIFSEGLATESFQPGETILAGFEDEIREELATLFPEIADGTGYGPAARPSLRAFEARVLMGAAV